jgi:hypothetical protein
LRLALAALLLVAVAGCRLIDQRTFGAAPTAPQPAALAQPGLPASPLLTLQLTNPDFDWRTPLDDAVRAALARKPDVAFDVVAPIPTNAPLDKQDAYMRTGRADMLMIAQALEADGIPPARITLALRGDPGTPPREIRLYVH